MSIEPAIRSVISAKHDEKDRENGDVLMEFDDN